MTRFDPGLLCSSKAGWVAPATARSAQRGDGVAALFRSSAVSGDSGGLRDSGGSRDSRDGLTVRAGGRTLRRVPGAPFGCIDSCRDLTATWGGPMRFMMMFQASDA